MKRSSISLSACRNGAQRRAGAASSSVPQECGALAPATCLDFSQNIQDFSRRYSGDRALGQGRGEISEEPTVLAESSLGRIVRFQFLQIFVRNPSESRLNRRFGGGFIELPLLRRIYACGEKLFGVVAPQPSICPRHGEERP